MRLDGACVLNVRLGGVYVLNVRLDGACVLNVRLGGVYVLNVRLDGACVCKHRMIIQVPLAKLASLFACLLHA